MILVGGSSMHKGAEGWQGARAVACLPALTGNLGVPGAGTGARHGASSHGQGLASIAARERRPPGDDVPDQMSRITEALENGRVRRAPALRHRHGLVVRRRRAASPRRSSAST